MTAFTRDMVPATVVTTEQLEVWVSELHTYLYGARKVTEAIDNDGNPIDVFVAETEVFYNTAVETPHYRHLSRHSIEIRPEYKISGKIWEHAKTLGDEVVPQGMRS